MALLEGLRGQHILLTDLDSWRRRLLGSPWVEDAALRRVLPSTVEVVIRERQPMAIARLNGSLYLVDEEGLVIDDYSPNYAQLDLPIVDGLTDGAAEGRSVDRAGTRGAGVARSSARSDARPELLQRVSQIDVTNPNDAVLMLESDTALVHVGSEQFIERSQAYLGLAEALHARVPDIEYVDLRFADRVYVRPAAGVRHEAASPAPAVNQRLRRRRGTEGPVSRGPRRRHVEGLRHRRRAASTTAASTSSASASPSRAASAAASSSTSRRPSNRSRRRSRRPS